MNKLFKILVIFLILLSSCSKNKKHFLNHTNEEVTFNIGFPIRNLDRELIHFNVAGTDYVAFANFSSYKLISVNTMDGKQSFTVPLSDFLKKNLVNLIAFDVPNLDTFALLSEYSDKAFLINKKGETIYKKDYSYLLLRGIYLYPPFHFENGILKTAIRWGPVTDTLTSIERNHINNYFPILFTDSDLEKDSNSTFFRLDSLYNRFTKDNEVSVELPQYLPIGNHTLFKSNYTDSIYFFNSRDKIDTIVKVTSKNFKLNFRPLSNKTIEQNDEVGTRNGPIYRHARIKSIKYDTFNQLIYVIIEGPKNKNDIANFSILLYDKNFKKLDEILLKGQKFVDQIFVTHKGLYIRNRDDSLKTATFTLFRYEEKKSELMLV